jgi:hypothetical protein
MITFDIEISKILPDGWHGDIFQFSPLGIACAGINLLGRFNGFSAPGKMTKKQCQNLVDLLLSLQKKEVIVTYNGCSFDFRLLAEESGMHEECVELALNHCDLMLIAVCRNGWRVKLDNALSAHGLKSKKHSITLNDGSIIEDMSGARAPQLWAQGEYSAVLNYLERDCESLLELACDATEKKELRYLSKSGSVTMVDMPKLFTVRECMNWTWPDQSWMTDPPRPENFWSWMNR